MLPYAIFEQQSCNNNFLMREIIRKFHFRRKSTQLQKSSTPFSTVKENSIFMISSAEQQDLGLIKYAAGNCESLACLSLTTPDSPVGRNLFEMLGPQLETVHRRVVLDYLNNPDIAYLAIKKQRYLKKLESIVYKTTDMITILSPSLVQGFEFVTCVEVKKQTDFHNLIIFNH